MPKAAARTKAKPHTPLHIRIRPADRERLERAADSLGMTVGAFMRMTALERAQQIEARAKAAGGGEF